MSCTAIILVLSSMIFVHPHHFLSPIGGVAQMVERSLSMREVRGSIPRASMADTFFRLACLVTEPKFQLRGTRKKFASSGNRTRAARVAGEHSTTEPSMLCTKHQNILGSRGMGSKKKYNKIRISSTRIRHELAWFALGYTGSSG